MIHEPGSVRARLRTTTDHAWRLYCILELEVPHRQETGPDQAAISHQRRVVAPAPWNSVAAELTLEFAEEIRRLEVHLKERVSGGYPRRRGLSSTNTRMAADSVVNLCEACDDATVLGVLGFLATWARRAERYFNPAGGLHRLPRQPGEGEARCPYCERPTMRWSPNIGIAVCVNPACRNANGQRPRWSAEFTIFGDQLTFRWDELETAA
jgi:hypothetical protein